MILKESFILSNKVTIPKIGFGTWQITENPYESTTYALKAGYRHIDTAEAYGNEKEIGRAIKDSKIARNEIFITSKLPAEIKGYDVAIQHFHETLKRLDVDYLDLYLIHAPWPWSEIGADYTKENIETWKAFVKLYEEGKIRSIGVSNFNIKDLEAVIAATNFIPHVNQIPIHITHSQDELRAFCREKGILVEAYSPLATGRILKEEKIVAVANKYNVSAAQLCIRFCLELDTLPLPKSTNEQRIISNVDVNFKIKKEDMEYLLKLKI